MEQPARTGRPREFEPSAAVAAAMEVFRHLGYASAAVPQLSRAAGVSTSSIYNTFGSKHEVYLAALDLYLEQAREHLYGPMLTGSDGVADIEAFLDRLRSVAAAEPGLGCLLTKATAEFGDTDQAVAERTTGYRRELREAFSAALTRAQVLGQPGERETLPVTALAELLVALVLSFNLLAGAGAPRHELDALLDSARALVRGQLRG
jgi:TetR/AcrR family transcriptional repressor of nem operon